MLKKLSMVGVLLCFVFVFMSCSNKKTSNSTSSNLLSSTNEKAENKPNESTVMSATSETSSSSIMSEAEETNNKKIEAFNNLPEKVQIQLIAETVDNRAYPEDGKSLEERGYYLSFYEYQDYVIFQIGFGAGSGHPIFILDYDDNSVTPRDGVVRNGYQDYGFVTVSNNPVSKASLYDNYLENKDAYSNSIDRVNESDKISEMYETTRKAAEEQN